MNVLKFGLLCVNVNFLVEKPRVDFSLFSSTVQFYQPACSLVLKSYLHTLGRILSTSLGSKRGSSTGRYFPGEDGSRAGNGDRVMGMQHPNIESEGLV